MALSGIFGTRPQQRLNQVYRDQPLVDSKVEDPAFRCNASFAKPFIPKFHSSQTCLPRRMSKSGRASAEGGEF